MGELGGHDLRRADAAAEGGFVYQEPRRRRILAGQDHLAFEPRGEACADLVFGHARVDGQDRAGIVRGLQQARQDAELPDAKARGALLVFYPAAEPWRGGDPGA